MKSLKNDESDENIADQVVAGDESEGPAENLHLVEGGKKDPHIRRQELLVSSGLAEVCGFTWTSSLVFVYVYIHTFGSFFCFDSFF